MGKPLENGDVMGINPDWLVVWNMNFIFPYLGNVIIPTDELIFFRGVETTNRLWWFNQQQLGT